MWTHSLFSHVAITSIWMTLKKQIVVENSLTFPRHRGWVIFEPGCSLGLVCCSTWAHKSLIINLLPNKQASELDCSYTECVQCFANWKLWKETWSKISWSRSGETQISLPEVTLCWSPIQARTSKRLPQISRQERWTIFKVSLCIHKM